MKEKIVVVNNLSFSYGINKVLDNVSFYIEEGDFVGIIGTNGSAKSTLLKLILGLLKPDQGTIKLLNKNINEFKNFEEIGYISQNVRDFNQMFPATVEEIVAANLYLKRGLFSRLKEEDNLKVEEALKIVEMEKFKKRKIGNLSGGQKQRVFIARALVNNPKILFMDEPLVGVDLDSQTKFYNLMEKLNKNHGITLIMVSHDIGAISKKVNKILCLGDGKVYCHDSNKCKCGNILSDIYIKNMDILFHNH
jgi:zinc transport system ATP-binding protein